MADCDQGLTGSLGTAWNAGTCCLWDYPSPVDDVAFSTSALNIAQLAVNIDPNRIYSFGFSNGGFMSERLGCTLPHLFRAIGSGSGATILEPGNSEGLANCDKLFKSGGQNASISLVHVHGNDDDVVPYEFGDPILGFPSVPANMAAWIAKPRDECDPKSIQTLNNPPYSNQLWTSCANGTSIELVTVDGGGHSWFSDSKFNETLYIVDFFKRQWKLD